AIALPGTIVIGCLAEPPSLLLATSADTGIDAGATLKPVLAALGGRGGGNARIAQGSLPAATPDERALAELAGALEGISGGDGRAGPA
ncbi:MAG: hypothetical protein SGJ01_17880, partial [Gemmatimonadota bacterium]|nr:hypothetical protein [Gemmatimonadota bacterium]